MYDLIQSMDKNEKRYFKLQCGASGSEDQKMLLLFDQLEKAKEFNEDEIPVLVPAIRKEQLSNMKAYLYQKVLQSLRQYHLSRIPEMKIREQIDFGQLLVERRHYSLALNCFRKAKKMAQQFNNLELQLEILRLEKELLLSSEGSEHKADQIIEEVRDLNSRINNINTYSNLSVKLNALYKRIGFIRDEAQYRKIKDFLDSNLPDVPEDELSAPEKMYLFRLLTGYYFFIQNFDKGYYYARQLESVFNENTGLIRSHPELFISSLNVVLNAQFKLNRYDEFIETSKKLEQSKPLLSKHLNENLRIRLLKYFYLHQINLYFMRGEFDPGVDFIRRNISEVQDLAKSLDQHSSMILSYKIACLYFGAGSYNQCIRWLNRIIQIPNADMREDLHCFARILNLICHYEIGNFDVIGYFIISTYRFLLKKDDLHLFQKFILNFLKAVSGEEGKVPAKSFRKLKEQLLPLTSSPFEKRAFIYFDIISWLESKIEQRPVQVIIQEKFIKKLQPFRSVGG